MAALESGAKAPEITLPTVDGRKFSLTDALKHGPVVAAFFKMTCPVCQLALPHIERIFRAYGDGKVTFVAVSQNDRDGAAAFAREFGLTFPIALDDTSTYPVSNSYGITTVPTLFFIQPDGWTALSSVGWSKADIEDLNARVAAAAGVPKRPLFRPGEDLPEFKAG